MSMLGSFAGRVLGRGWRACGIAPSTILRAGAADLGATRRAIVASCSEQLGERPSLIHEVKRPAFPVNGVQVVDAHRMEDGAGDVFRADRVVVRVLGTPVGGTVDLATADAA